MSSDRNFVQDHADQHYSKIGSEAVAGGYNCHLDGFLSPNRRMRPNRQASGSGFVYSFHTAYS